MFKVYDILNIRRRFNSGSIKFHKDNGIKLLPPVSVKSGEDAFIAEVNQRVTGNSSIYKTSIKDKDNNEAGYHLYSINKHDSYMFGIFIDTLPEYRNRGIGEVLRLINIIEMVENKIKNNFILSLSSAAQFHSKYKFIPDIRTPDCSYLQEILFSKYSTEAMKVNAANLFNKTKDKVCVDDEYFTDLNDLVQKYIEKNHSNWEDAKFTATVPMKLDLDTIRNNAEFYNKLFTKHGIDYRV